MSNNKRTARIRPFQLIAERGKKATGELLAFIDFNAKAIANARYALKVTAVSEKGGVVEVKKEFDNAWINMPYPLYDIELAVRLMEGIMITSDEVGKLLDGNPAEQRRKFLAFWKAQDPTPDTEFNEALEEYFRRVDYTFFNFYTNREYGWRTDRGRVYIRYGKPTEVSREFPANRPTREIWIYKNLNKRFVFSDITNTGNYNLGFKAKLALPAVPLRPVVIAGYNDFSREGITLKNRILTFGAGVEYSPVSFGIVSPYLGLDAAMNILSSNATDAHGVTRFGGGVGIGAELNLPAFPVSFDLEAKYRFNNLVGKMETELGRNHLQIGVTVGFKLF